MEEKKDYNKQQPLQKFYFTDDGKLVVESNKGVWVDGTPYVKMYGNFTCNAKTMGAIISHLKGIKVEVGDETTYVVDRSDMFDTGLDCDIIEEKTYCILGVNHDVIDDVLNKKAHEIAETEFAGKMSEYERRISEYERRISEESDKNNNLERVLTTFNDLPWYKRMFAKIRIA